MRYCSALRVSYFALTVAFAMPSLANDSASSQRIHLGVESAAQNGLDWQPVSLDLPSTAGLRVSQSSSNEAPAGVSPPKVETLLMSASFEEPWPASPWTINHPEDAADVDWGRTDARAANGSHSIWCAARGSETTGSSSVAPLNTAAWAIVGPFDLSEAVSGRFSFDLWLRTETYSDFFMWLVSVDGRVFSGEATSTDTHGWETVTADLAAIGGGVVGASEVWIAFVYQSDGSDAFEGAYVDSVNVVSDSGSLVREGITFADDEDFKLGSSLSIAVVDDGLQLASDWETFPNLWVPASQKGLVSKVDTITGNEIARYLTGPASTTPEPGGVAVDLDGGCWIANRGAGTLVKIGLVEAGNCVDRNNNGLIETSQDVNENGAIEGEEMLPWGEDECVLLEIVLAEGNEKTYLPGDDHGSWERNELRATAVDADNSVWAGVGDSQYFYKISSLTGAILRRIDVSDVENKPYDAVIDRNGFLWSADWPKARVLRIDTKNGRAEEIALSHGSSALALDGDGHLFVVGHAEGQSTGSMSRVDLATNEVKWTVDVVGQPTAIAITGDGDVWIASSVSNSLSRYTNDGIPVSSISISNRPAGLAVDDAGKVWQLGASNSVIARVNSKTNRIELQRNLQTGGEHDAVGDLTGIVARVIPARYGAWSVIYDSQFDGTSWGKLSWLSDKPNGTSVEVRVRSSADLEIWSNWEKALNAALLKATPAGRYLEIEVTLQSFSNDLTPVFEELTVMPSGLAPEVAFSWEPVQIEIDDSVSFVDRSIGNPTTWSWNFGDGSTSAEQHPSHSYPSAGTYIVKLEAANEWGSHSDSQRLSVAPKQECTIACSVEAPSSGSIDVEIAMSASITTANCQDETLYSWDFGDGEDDSGVTTFHRYLLSGSYQWTMNASTSGASCSAGGVIEIEAEGPETCDFTYWVPVAVHASGAYSSSWRSDLGLLGFGTTDAAVRLQLHGNGGPFTANGAVKAGAMVRIPDVVARIITGADHSGALEVCSDQSLVVTSRTYNLLATDDPCMALGTMGQVLDGVESSTGMAAGEVALLSHLAENGAFRTNIGVVNTGSSPATVEIRLHDESGNAVSSFRKDLAPGEWWQDIRPFSHRAGIDDIAAGWARVEVVSGSGIFTVGFVIDNLTNDASAIRMRCESCW